jgi:predicted transposase/invertase (TIGR01784 family)
LNPITEPVVLDDKLSILDIKARDQSGRLFNIEMQLVVNPSLRRRFLYYWARLYSSQLHAGQEYEKLRPVISIFFLDGILFPDSEDYHLPFTLFNQKSKITYSDHLQIHIFQLVNFRKTASELSDPLEKWIYFLNNGKDLEVEELPASLQEPQIQEAVRTLHMLTQDELERERYEAREKARRDAISWQKMLENAQRAVEQSQQQAEQAKVEAEQVKAEAKAERVQGLITQIRLCERWLKRTPVPEEHLKALSPEQLQQMMDQLQAEVFRPGDSSNS